MSGFARRLQQGISVAATGSSAWPDATNTGVAVGTTFVNVPDDVTSGPGWVYSGGNLMITSDNTVLDGYQIGATVQVMANGVTIQNCKISFLGGGGDNFGITLQHTTNATVQHCEISGLVPAGGADDNRLTAGIKDTYADSVGAKVLANNIYDVSCGVQLVSGLVQDNYIHDMAYNSTDHVDCVLNGGGGSDMTIRHNTLLNPVEQTAAIAIYNQTFGPPINVTVDNNLVAGGGYCIYGGGGGSTPSQNIVIINNKVSTRYFAQGGQYGPAATFNAGDPGNVWSGNVWVDGPNVGQTIGAP